MPYIQANGIKIHYERTGGDQPPLILCHGITDSGACWPRLAPVLSNDYDLIMLDARGHGLSEAPESGYRWDILGEDVAAVIKELGLQKPGILGHSMGAATAAITAAFHPESVGYIVLEDPPFRATTAQPESMAAEYEQRIRDRRTMTTEQMIEYTLRRDPGVANWDKSEFGPWSEAKRRVSLNVVQLLRSGTPSYPQTVGKITCPALLIAADPARGGIITPAVAAAVHAARPNIQVATIPNAGHNIRRENFEAYVAAVTTFLRSL